MDVSNLYTDTKVYRHKTKIIEEIFLKYPDPKRPEKELLELFINLTRNDFEFNGNYHLQIKGTAMGKKFAPAYANIFRAWWEGKALQASSKKTTTVFQIPR